MGVVEGHGVEEEDLLEPVHLGALGGGEAELREGGGHDGEEFVFVPEEEGVEENLDAG